MRILCIADTHVSEFHSLAGGNVRGESGDRLSLEIGRQSFKWAASIADEYEVDAVIHAGDVFDRAQPTPGELVVARHGLASTIRDRAHVLLAGNHDLGYGNGVNALSPFEQLDEFGDGFDVHAAPDSLVWGDGEVEIFTLPYPDLGRFKSSGSRLERNARASDAMALILADIAAEASKSRAAKTILVSHVTYGGAEYDSGQLVASHDVAVPTGFLSVFDVVVAGHLHKRQPLAGLESAFYIGPPTRWSFNDEGNPAGALLLDTSTGSLEWLENPGAPEFVTVDVTEVADAEAHVAGECYVQHLNGEAPVFVRLVGEVEGTEYARVEQLAEQLAERWNACRNDVTVRNDRTALEGVDVRDDFGLFDHYVETRPDAIPSDEVPAVRDLVGDVLEAIQ